MTAPLTPADCDLRAFATMPLDANRLFGSEFHAVASDAAWRAGVTLWLRAWHQVPAASLPDDDVQLTRLAELGRDVKAWRKLRNQALHGWIKCEDGRLYHPVVADLANKAWVKRKAFKDRSAKASEKRWPSKEDNRDAPKGLLVGDDKDSSNDPKGEERERDTPLDKSNGVDPEKIMFDAGVVLLGAAGIKADRARGMLGKWKRDHGAEAVIAALGRAQREGAIEPIGFIEGCFKQVKRQTAEEFASPC